jgi:hypothetical protein
MAGPLPTRPPVEGREHDPASSGEPKGPARPQGMKNLQFTPNIPQFG